jgi:hypothetical protein
MAMYQALVAACCALAGLQPPLSQDWSDTTLISTDDDWSRVPAMVGFRGDGLTTEPGTDPRTVLADGSGTPVDVTANRTDPGAIGLAAGVAEFELADPVVALRGSATASAPHLVLALDTRGRTRASVRLNVRDLDAAADAVEPVAIQYRVGASGDFANVPGAYLGDATPSYGPDSARAASTAGAGRIEAALPAAADNRPLVQVRVLTTNAVGRDEWVGIDDIRVHAARLPRLWPRTPPPAPPDAAPPPEPPAAVPPGAAPVLTGLSLRPTAFLAARRGPALASGAPAARPPVAPAAGARTPRRGAGLRFRLSEPAKVRFRVLPGGPRLRFQASGRRGLNRLRFSARVRGRALGPGLYVLSAAAVDRFGRASNPTFVRFRVLNGAKRPQKEG